MASSLIHIAVAKEVNKYIYRDPNELFIGTIAPDISKYVGTERNVSHFIDNGVSDIPNIERFLDKYQKYLDDDFVMGYYIHILTDYLWFKYFLVNYYDDNFITKIDGTKVKYNEEEFYEYVYNDYTNMNDKLINEYDLDLKMFYAPIPEFRDIIKEIPMEKIKVIIDKTSEIIKDAKTKKYMLFNIKNVSQFIEFATNEIVDTIKKTYTS